MLYLLVLAWLYVAILMAVTEAASPQGTVLGALLGFIFFGLAPLVLVLYLSLGRYRRQARARAEQASQAKAKPSDDNAQP